MIASFCLTLTTRNSFEEHVGICFAECKVLGRHRYMYTERIPISFNFHSNGNRELIHNAKPIQLVCLYKYQLILLFPHHKGKSVQHSRRHQKCKDEKIVFLSDVTKNVQHGRTVLEEN